MNRLERIESLGYKVTWRLIVIGLFGESHFAKLLTRSEVYDYLQNQLHEITDTTDKVIELLTWWDEEQSEQLLNTYANTEGADTNLQYRKWRYLLLSETLDSIKQKGVEASFELYEFWGYFDLPVGETQVFQNADEAYQFLGFDEAECDSFIDSLNQRLTIEREYIRSIDLQSL